MYMFSFLLEEATCEGSILKNCKVLSTLYSVKTRKDHKEENTRRNHIDFISLNRLQEANCKVIL